MLILMVVFVIVDVVVDVAIEVINVVIDVVDVVAALQCNAFVALAIVIVFRCVFFLML